jgi:hypothetical protein
MAIKLFRIILVFVVHFDSLLELKLYGSWYWSFAHLEKGRQEAYFI